MPLYTISGSKGIEHYTAYISESLRNKFLDRITAYKKIAEDLELDDKVYSDLINERAAVAVRDAAANKIMEKINERIQKEEDLKASRAKIPPKKDESPVGSKDLKHIADSKTKTRTKTKDTIDDKDDNSEDEGLEDHESSTMQASFDAHKKAMARRLKALALEEPLECYGQAINYKQYMKNTEDLYKNIPKDYPIDVYSKLEEDTLTVTVPSQDDESEDVIVRSYDKKMGCPKVSITNPQDDHSIILMLDMNKDLMPLKMINPCNHPETAMRIFEASVISGRPLELHPDDHDMLNRSDQYRKRYQYLTSLLQENGKAQLDTFRKFATENEDWKFAASEIPEAFYKEAPVFHPKVIDFQTKTPKV